MNIDFSKVINFSKINCFQKSQSLCATYVKKAFEAGGCNYVVGNGWDNQKFCEDNDFKCIGDFVPIDNNPRPHNGIPIQFPEGYKQQVGDICLIKHGTYGHICYAVGNGINDWVSDYWQKSPGQEDGTGPYCYTSNYERIQFWRHSSVMGDEPVITSLSMDDIKPIRVNTTTNSGTPSTPNNVYMLSSSTRVRDDVLKQNDGRKAEFESLLNSMSSSVPQFGRSIIKVSSDELYDSNILKGDRVSKNERS